MDITHIGHYLLSTLLVIHVLAMNTLFCATLPNQQDSLPQASGQGKHSSS